jgi:hypothetical protein
MKTKLMTLLLVAGGSVFAQTRFSIDVHFGAPVYYRPAQVVPAPVVTAYRPPCPGAGYVWIDGYSDGYGRWFDGYWASPPYAGAYWVAPRFYGGRFNAGHWGGARVYSRDEYRFRESREHEWRERQLRGRRGVFEREDDHDLDRRGDYGRGFRQ